MRSSRSRHQPIEFVPMSSPSFNEVPFTSGIEDKHDLLCQHNIRDRGLAVSKRLTAPDWRRSYGFAFLLSLKQRLTSITTRRLLSKPPAPPAHPPADPRFPEPPRAGALGQGGGGWQGQRAKRPLTGSASLAGLAGEVAPGTFPGGLSEPLPCHFFSAANCNSPRSGKRLNRARFRTTVWAWRLSTQSFALTFRPRKNNGL